MSLEVDRRDDLPMTCREQDGGYYYSDLQPYTQRVGYGTPAFKPAPSSRRCCGLRPVTLILSIALAVVTILAIVAAGVGGSLAAKNRTHPSSSQPVSNTINSSCNATNSTSPTTNGTTFKPTDSCGSMGGSFNTSSPSFRFNLLCDTDLTGYDLVGVFVYYFSDCIQACVNFNTFDHPNNESCYAVTYDLGHTPTTAGNCFLKNMQDIPQHSLSTGSSAYMATAGEGQI